MMHARANPTKVPSTTAVLKDSVCGYYIYISVPLLTRCVHSFADSLVVLNKYLFSTYYMLCTILRPGDTVEDRIWNLHSNGGKVVIM